MTSSYPNTQDGYVWIEATGKPGMHAQSGEVSVYSRNTGDKVCVHRSEVATYVDGGCFRIADPQPPIGGSYLPAT